jgi:hypothetical protein
MSEPRTLLVIAGEFPPLKTIGRIRTVKFVDQLRQHGWRSIVITLKPSGTEPNYDPSLMAEIVDGVEVVRCRSATARRSPMRSSACSGASRRAGRQRRHCVRRCGGRGGPGGHGALRRADGPRPRDDALGAAQLVDVPDDFRLWADEALKVARKLCAERRIDAVSRPSRPSRACSWAMRCAARPACRGSPTTATCGTATCCASGCPSGARRSSCAWSAACCARPT